MKEIPLALGLKALVDNKDYEMVSKYKWGIQEGSHGTFYAVADVRINGKHTKIYMHRLIAGTPKGMVTDHIDHNGLNNQRYNLRIVTYSMNQMNMRVNKIGTTSKYKGVYWTGTKWRARIKKDGVTHSLGCYDIEEEAALAYNRKAIELFGEYACLNVIDDMSWKTETEIPLKEELFLI